MGWGRWIALAMLLAALTAAQQLPAAEGPPLPAHVAQFLKTHCYRCHGAEVRKAGLRLDQHGTDFTQGKTADAWKEVIDMINLGEMPPADEPRPDPAQALAVVEWVAGELRRADRAARETGGRVLLRRLNRDQYAYTAGDLLQLSPNFVQQLREELPADGKAEGFDRIATALFFDQTLMEKYLAAADLIVREAIQDAPPPVAQGAWRTSPKQIDLSPLVKVTDTNHEIPRGPSFAAIRHGGIEYVSGKRTFQKPLDKAGWMAIPTAEIKLDGVVTRDGMYRVRVRGGAFVGDRGEPVRVHFQYARDTPIEERGTVVVGGMLDHPEVSETMVFLRAGRGEQKVSVAFQWNGTPDLVPANPDLLKLVNKRVSTFAKIPELIAKKAPQSQIDGLKQELDAAIKEIHAFTGPAYVYNSKYDLKTVPRLYLESIEVAGPIVEWPPASHTAIGYGEAAPTDAAGARSIFASLLPRAYRRPVADDEIDRLVAVADKAMRERGLTFRQALRAGLKTMLCSPGFLYLSEPAIGEGTAPRRLNDYKLANRLSYFLWSSPPDAELFALAAKGELQKPETQRAQTKRMLSDARARRFVESFAGQWLDVEEFGSVDPAREYTEYDDALEAAERAEPAEFFGYVLGQNKSILSFLDSDFLVINDRLARHYGIAGVKGPEFRAVAIGPEDHRGGVLGMGGLLTLLADGTRTLPVRRAAWVLEKLLSDPPLPPPPNAGDIQPNTSGELLTVRERLARHRTEANCASCHVKLDPYGLALENYDAIGAWRTQQNGEGIRGAKAPRIDASGMLKSGRKFEDLAGFKAALLAEKEKFVRALVEKMLTYALGRPVGYVDRQAVDDIVAATAADDYRIQTMLQSVIASEPFQTK